MKKYLVQSDDGVGPQFVASVNFTARAYAPIELAESERDALWFDTEEEARHMLALITRGLDDGKVVEMTLSLVER